MSLQVWLPLNGNLNNQGLNGGSVTSTSSNYSFSASKLGKGLAASESVYCYCSTGSLVSEITLTNSYSMCAWVKTTDTSGYLFNIGNYNNTARAKTRGLWLNSNGTFQWAYTGSGTTASDSAINDGVWHHIVFVVSGSTVTTYIDGSRHKIVTASITSQVTGYEYASVHVTEKTMINDFRVYDHCLSAKEVKEIARGLILHYKLSGFGNPNLMPNSKDMYLGTTNASTGTWRIAGSNTMTRSRVYIEDSPIGCCYGFQNSGQQTNTGDASCYGIDKFPRTNGTTYTASMYARVVSGGPTAQAGMSFLNATYVSGSDTKKWSSYYMTEITTEWTRCIYTFTSTSTSANIYFGVGTDGVDTVIQCCGFKIEEGTVVTPWCPKSSDEIYSSLGYDSTTEYDCSGFGSNGTKKGSILWDVDSPRYIGSYKFSGGQYLTFTNMLTSSNTDFTIACFLKNTSAICTICSMRTAMGEGISLFKLNTNRFRFDDGSLQTTFSNYTYTANTWIHIAVTRTSSEKRLYINGELVQTVTSVGDLGSIGTAGSIGASSISGGNFDNYTNGNMSDFRIYATALSAADIKALYNTSGSVDKTGNLYAYEFMEEE